jgi:hypothetical protein
LDLEEAVLQDVPHGLVVRREDAIERLLSEHDCRERFAASAEPTQPMPLAPRAYLDLARLLHHGERQAENCFGAVAQPAATNILPARHVQALAKKAPLPTALARHAHRQGARRDAAVAACTSGFLSDALARIWLLQRIRWLKRYLFPPVRTQNSTPEKGAPVHRVLVVPVHYANPDSRESTHRHLRV